ncbi:MAG: hypothetical protein AAGJ83_11860, partial [Planctomycetota bacterium]
APQMYCRVINRSTDKPLLVTSFTSRTNLVGQKASDQLTGRRNKRVTVRAQSPDWIDNLTRDLDVVEDRAEFEPTTIRLHRLWLAATRLRGYREWFGNDRFDLTVDLTTYGGTWQAALVERVCRSMSRPNDLSIRTTGFSREEASSTFASMESPGDADASRGSLIGCEPLQDDPRVQLVRTLVDRPGPMEQSVVLRYDSLPLTTFVDLSFGLAQFGLSDRWFVVPSGNTDSSHGTLRVLVGNPAEEEPPQPAGLSKPERRKHLLFLNGSPWRQRVEFFFDDSPSICVVHSLGAAAQDLPMQVDAGKCALQLPPTSIVCLDVVLPAATASDDNASIGSWNAVMVNPQPTIARCKSLIGEIIATTGSLELPQERYESLRNGGFETKGQVGIVGWMQTQFPPDAVVLDESEATEGRYSIRMTNATEDERTWVVSERIPVPDTSRLAVSLALRAAAVANPSTPNAVETIGSDAISMTHQLRVSLEGDRDGSPVRIVAELETPRDGQWHPRQLVLESDSLDLGSQESVRLTVDSLSPGTIWIDDVRLHDRFATREERGRLHRQAYLAVQGLRRGDLAPASRLAGNYWTRSLLKQSNWTLSNAAGDGEDASRPADVQARPVWVAGTMDARHRGDATSDSGPAVDGPPAHRGVAERLREWLPRPIRF